MAFIMASNGVYNMPQNIADILFKEGKITKEQYDSFLAGAERTKNPVYSIVARSGAVSEEDLVQARAKILDIPYIDLREKRIPENALTLVSEKTAEAYSFIPFEIKDGALKIAMVDPEDFKALEACEFVAKRKNLRPDIYITTSGSFEDAFRQYGGLREEVRKVLIEAEAEVPEEMPKKLEAREVEKIIEEAPVSKAVVVILRHAVDGRASDVHIEPLEEQTRIRYRIDGVLRSTLMIPKRIHPAVVARIKVLSNLKIDETRIPQDGKFRQKIVGKNIDFRVACMPQTEGEKVEIRILEVGAKAPSLEELGLGGRNLRLVERYIERPFGMIIVCGPTGSGKSTTLYAGLSVLNKIGVNIVTIEDPVEYFIPGVNQIQVRPGLGLDFASGLRSILRQDPDIIMVGEIRDKETAAISVHAALTGHLILSTLHTNTACGAIPRLIDMRVEPFLLNACLNLVVGQRLVRKICERCKKEVKLSSKIKEELEKKLDEIPEEKKDIPKEIKIYKGEGCKYCGREGYKGRIAIFEVLEITPEMREIIARQPSIDKIREEAHEQKMITMEQDGILKMLRGITTYEEVLRVTQ